MAQRWFSADFHIGMEDILKFENRPFSSIDEMNSVLLSICCTQAKSGDIIYHLGDLFSFGGVLCPEGDKMKPKDFFKPVKATFINIRGNHDINNRVISVAESLKLGLGDRFPNVSLSHYPSYDKRAKGQFDVNSIHLCGHVHSKWKHCLDRDHNVLNINVGVDVCGYRLMSEDELIRYLNFIFKKRPDELNTCKTSDGKLVLNCLQKF